MQNISDTFRSSTHSVCAEHGIRNPLSEKVAVGESINSDAISGKVLSDKEKIYLKKDQDCYDTAALYYHPLRRIRTRYSVGAKIFLCSGLQDWEARCTACTACWRMTSVREGCVSFFSVPQELYQAVRSSINRFCRQCYLHQNRRELRNKLRHRPQSVVISAGRLPNALKCGSDFIGITHSWWCVRRALFSATGCEYFWRSQKPRLLKPGMSVERVISIANASVGFQG